MKTFLAGLAVVAVSSLVGAWLFMVVVGIVHAEWLPVVQRGHGRGGLAQGGGDVSEPTPDGLHQITVNLTPQAYEAMVAAAAREQVAYTDTVNRALIAWGAIVRKPSWLFRHKPGSGR